MTANERQTRRRRSNDGNAVDLVVKKLIRRSKWSVQSFSAFRMGEPGFFFVAHCGNFLKVLEIPMSSITDQMVLKHIKPLPNLTTLDISNCLKITRKGIAAFGNQCKSLVNLRRNMPPLEACSPIDDSETKAIAETMPNLKQINLCFGRFGDMGLSEILMKCKSLTHLDIQGSWNVELNGDLEERCERLEHFQNPWVNYENDFFDSGSSDDDESEQESELD
ncbi:F-box protein FBW2-like protein [Tanacetum coccineum]